MRPIATDVALFFRSVGPFCTGHINEPCKKNGLADRDAFWRLAGLRGHKKPLLWTYARPTLFGLFQSSRLLDATNNRKWGLHTSAMRSVATMPVAAWYFESLYLPGNIRQQQNKKKRNKLVPRRNRW